MGKLGVVLALLLIPQDLDQRRDDLSARLESLRGLRFRSPVTLREGSRREYAAYVLENAKRVYGSDLSAAEKGLKALGLIPPNHLLHVTSTSHAVSAEQVFASGCA